MQSADGNAAAAIESILGATDHYAALDAPGDAPAAELRKRYLAMSVRVHPDKNPHPDATRAFQRVTAAWSVLSDPDKRQLYDRELALGADGAAFCQGDWQDMSPDEALAVFAMAAAMAASSSDLAETLFWAQQMGSMKRVAQQPGHPPSASAASIELQATAAALAVSCGMWFAGGAVGYMGLRRIGSMTRRVAMIQGVSQLIFTLQSPTVRQALHAGGAAAASRVEELSSSLSSFGLVVRDKADELIGLSRLDGVMPSWCSQRSCLPRLGSSVDRFGSGLRPGFLISRSGGSKAGRARPADPGEAGDGLLCGSWVRLSGLVAARHLDGCLGEVVGYDATTQRYKVRLLAASSGRGSDETGAVKLLKRENLLSALSRSSEPPSAERDFL